MDKKPLFSERRQNMINLAEAIPLVKPLSAAIELSGVCNFQCAFCPQSTKAFRKSGCFGHMTKDTFNKVWSELVDWEGPKLKTLHLYGIGESLLNPDFAEIFGGYRYDFSHLCEQSILTTNASLLTGGKANAILESNLDYLRISIYSVIQERHERITKSKIDVNEIYENIAHFKEMRDLSKRHTPFICIKMIDTFSDENQLFIDKYSHLADEIIIESPMNWNGEDNFIRNAYGDTSPLLQSALSNEVCAFPFYQMHISNNGDVKVCCVDHLDSLVMGNVNNVNIKEIWKSQILLNLQIDFLCRKQKEYDVCKNCNYFNLNPWNANIDNISKGEFLKRRKHK